MTGSVISNGCFSRPTTPGSKGTPGATGQDRRPPLPLSESAGCTPNGGWQSASSMSLGKAATPGGSTSAKAAAKRQHDLEMRLWHADQKLIDTQSKLTGANLELAKFRQASEAHQQEASYTQRLLEREQRERTRLETELAGTKDSHRLSLGGGGRTSLGAPGSAGERGAILRAQLEEAQERAGAFAQEVAHLKQQLRQLNQALSARGNEGELLKELSTVKDERVRLALELHEAKSTASKAKHAAAEATSRMRAVDGLRDSLAETSAGMAAARAEVERLTAERAAALEEHGALLAQVWYLAGCTCTSPCISLHLPSFSALRWHLPVSPILLCPSLASPCPCLPLAGVCREYPMASLTSAGQGHGRRVGERAHIP